MSDDPRTNDYTGATRRCDVVMKGGITSGVVYPHAVCELAQTYRLANVGGTSAGAIAAAAAAAAEVGRGSGGFRRLAELPDWLGAGTNLFSLFRPQPRTRRIYRLLTAGLGGAGKGGRLLGAALKGYWLPTAIGALPGIVLIVLGFLGSGAPAVVAAIVGGLLLALIGAGAGLVAGLVKDAVTAIPGNDFGLCSGMGGRTTLTPWLTDLLDDLAGRPHGPEDAPLTFGDLEDEAGDRITLAMMTTNLVQRRAETMPFEHRAYFFHPDEMRRFFPERVVRHMVDHPPAAETGSDEVAFEVLCRRMLPLRPLPAPEHLPVVVGARMSLSFPVLISAVPLWGLDMTREDNQAAQSAWGPWLSANRGQWDALKADEAAWAASAPPAHRRLTPDRCWFSDGGISSNFPVHFFDQPLPRWPTFAITLEPFHPDRTPDADEELNVWVPRSNAGGILETWLPLVAEDAEARAARTAAGPSATNDAAGAGALAGFVGAIVRTMQNRVDTAQSRIPGYRDRIAHINHTKGEGGMNLSMPPAVIAALTARGLWAARKLASQFAIPQPGDRALTWDNHRWVRYRSTMAAVEQVMTRVADGYDHAPAGERTYRELIERKGDEPPASYRWARAAQRDFAAGVTAKLVATHREGADTGQTFGEGAPNPRPALRISPSP